jgi:putative SbcD/Mre11-related phosphoesterase
MWLGEWLLTPQRVAVHGPSATAVVADVHLGYAAARQRRGDAVPPTSVAEALRPLALVLAQERARRVVVAGDLFEEGCRLELAAELQSWLDEHDARLELVPGNHDRSQGLSAAGWPVHVAGLEVGGWQVLHGDGTLPAGPVLHGHVHPVVRRGRWKWPCYLHSATRLVLPAFSAEAAGGNVLGEPAWRGCRCLVIAEGRVDDLGVLREM